MMLAYDKPYIVVNWFLYIHVYIFSKGRIILRFLFFKKNIYIFFKRLHENILKTLKLNFTS